ncbi:MAG: hypothetical protein NC452_11170 [Eubacterium sp.]|nr:hypothetical protein [Eubacterium sp.]
MVSKEDSYIFFTAKEPVIEKNPAEIEAEHKIMLQEKIEKMYGMGSDYLLSEDECSYEYLAQKIIEMEDSEAYKLENEYRKTKLLSDKIEYDIYKRIKKLC